MDYGFGKHFLDVASKAQVTKEKTSKWDYMKLKNILVEKEISVKRQPVKIGENMYKPCI